MIIQQCLHGYRDGHRLIAASASVSKESEKDLAIISDLSGSAGGQEFPPYLSGYPLAADKLYALSRTWPATEMRRPGCVWTHTLLIGFDCFASGLNLSVLMRQFRRPKNLDEATSYSRQINVASADMNAEFGAGSQAEVGVVGHWLEDVIRSYYDDLKPVMLLGEISLIEPVILALWGQGWASLQRSISFCTLALSPRKLKGRTFDIQGSAPEFFRKGKWANEPVAAIEISALQVGGTLRRDHWIKLVADDIRWPNANGLRDFLHRFGGDFTPERSGLKDLSIIFGLLMSGKSDEHSSLVDRIGELFPSPEKAVNLKAWLFRPQEVADPFSLHSAHYLPLISRLLTSEHISAFKSDAIPYREGVATHWLSAPLHQKQEVLKKLAIATEPEIADSIVDGLAVAIDASELMNSSEVPQPVLARIIGRKPSLLTNHELWLRLWDSSDLLDVIADGLKDLPEELEQEVVYAALEANADYAAQLLKTLWGKEVAFAVLRFVNMNDRRKTSHLGPAWQEVVREYSAEIVNEIGEWSEVSAAAIALVAKSLGVRVRRKDARTWLNIVEKLRPGEDDLSLSTKCFLIEVALQDSGKSASRLLQLAVRDVHDSLSYGNLPSEAWNRLQELLPHLAVWDSWDRAERLRRGVAAWYVRNDRPLSEVLALTDDEYWLKRILRTIGICPGGRYYLEQQLQQTSSEDSDAAAWKVELAQEMTRWGF